MTMVSPPNWYLDPTGRHQARYWDGFTWTAHVADGGRPTLDSLVRADPITAGSPDADASVGTVGPGTAQLRAMADTRSATPADDETGFGRPADPRIAKVEGVKRRPRVLDVTVLLVALVVTILGAYALVRNRDGTDPADRDAGAATTWTGDGYTLRIHPSWVEGDVPAGTDIDGRFSAIDAAPVVAVVGDEPVTRRNLTDTARIEQYLATDAQASLASGDISSQVVATEVVADGKRRIGMITVDVPTADGFTIRVTEYLVVGDERSVAVVLLGAPDGVVRHQARALATARSVRLG